jgi:hypothetical protein
MHYPLLVHLPLEVRWIVSVVWNYMRDTRCSKMVGRALAEETGRLRTWRLSIDNR